MAEEYNLGGNGSRDEDMDDDSNPEDLKLVVQELSQRAYSLAQEAASAAGESEGRKELAREMNGYLDELVPLIQAAPPQDQQMLQSAWTDARQDLLYVLSSGKMPTSLRLHHYLRGMGLDQNK